MAVFELFADLGLMFDKDVYNKKIHEHFITYLTNTAASVRNMGVKKSGQLAEKFKEEWIEEKYIPEIEKIYIVDKKGYNYRMCCLNSLSVVIEYIPKDVVT